MKVECRMMLDGSFVAILELVGVEATSEKAFSFSVRWDEWKMSEHEANLNIFTMSTSSCVITNILNPSNGGGKLAST